MNLSRWAMNSFLYKKGKNAQTAYNVWLEYKKGHP